MSRSVITVCGILASAPSGVDATILSTPAPAPDAADVRAAAERLSRWAASFTIPSPAAPESRSPIPGARAVYLALRMSGRIVGAATERIGATEESDAETTALLMRRAAGRAMSAMLADTAVGSARETLGDRIGPLIAVELEAAGPMEPLRGRTWERLAEQIDPGIDGIALRCGDEMALLFPAQLRASGSAASVDRRFTALALELGLPYAEYDVLQRDFDARAYRFSAVHAVQRGPGRPIRMTHRGGFVVPPQDVTPHAIAEAADRLIDHMLSSLVAETDVIGLRGDYTPTADRYTPALAPPRDVLLVVAALGRYAATPGLVEHHRSRAHTAARILLTATCDGLAGAGETDRRLEVGTACMLVLAVADLPVAEYAAPLIAERLADAVATLRMLPDDPGGLPDSAAALGGLALAIAADRGLGDPSMSAHARRLLDRLWERTPAGAWPNLLPWATWAPTAPTDRDRTEELIQMLAAAQLGRDEAPAPDDLRGGIDLSPRRSGRADAQSLRPGAAVARILTDHPVILTDEGKARAHGLLQGLLRFALQLAVRDEDLWAFPSPDRAIGGLRTAPWHADQPVAAQAMGLFLFSDALRLMSGNPDETP